MPLHVTDSWMIFCIAFGIVLLTGFIMIKQSANFYTFDVTLRKFGITDLALSEPALEIRNIIKGIYLLPAKQSQKTLRSLKTQLYINFLFMPAVYGAIFLMCIQVSSKMIYFGQAFFTVLAWLQLIPLLWAVIENGLLFKKIDPDIIPSTPFVYRRYVFLDVLKWGISLTGAVCSIAAMMYFWLAGNYSINSLYYLLILLGEIVIFFIARKVSADTAIKIASNPIAGENFEFKVKPSNNQPNPQTVLVTIDDDELHRETIECPDPPCHEMTVMIPIDSNYQGENLKISYRTDSENLETRNLPIKKKK